MKRCPECFQSFEDELVHCPVDGAALLDRAAPKDPFIGRILAGRYEVLELLGRGGFGVVYKVLDRKMDDLVAVKIFDRRRFGEEEAHQAIQRFRREGVLLRRLGKRTDKIVIVYDFEEDADDELFYFTMDFVDGVTLTKVLADEGPLPLPRALNLALQLCRALKAAHDEGIVHRDLKLDNIMITRDGDREIVKVLDFGIAKMVGSQSLTNLAMGVPGTAGFAPPEQLQRPQDIDHRTDLFSLGVVLYGLVTARGPWSGEPISEPTSSEKVWDLIRNSLEEAPIPIKKWRDDVPRRLESVILKLLEKDQGKRFQSAELLEEELKKVRRGVLGRPDAGKGLGLVEAFGSLATRFGVPPGLAFGGLVLILAAAGAGAWLLSSRTPTVPMTELVSAVEDGRILETSFKGDHLNAVLRGEDGAVGDVRVKLEGVGVQELASDFLARGVTIREEGRGSLRPLALTEGSMAAGSQRRSPGAFANLPEAPGAAIHLEGPGGGCSPCEPGGEVRLASGWYTVTATGEEWVLTAISLLDRERVLLDEEIDLAGATVFLPEDASLELVSVFAPTPTRALLTQAGAEVSAGRPREALYLIEQALAEAPGTTWGPALKDTVLMDVRIRALAAFDSGSPSDAQEWLPICQELDPLDQDCGRVEEWVSVRGELEAALQGGRTAQAATLASRCLGIHTEDPDCRQIQVESEARLAALRENIEGGSSGGVADPVRPGAPTGANALQPTPVRGDPAAEGPDLPPTETQQPAGNPELDPTPGDSAQLDRGEAPSAADTVEASEAGQGGGAGEIPGAQPPEEPHRPTLSVVDLSIGDFRFADNQFYVDVRFSGVGPGDVGVCVASIFANENRDPLPDTDGQFALGGLVAATQTFIPGTTLDPVQLSNTLPVEHLHQDRGPVRTLVMTRVWPGPCADVDPAIPPLAETSSQPLCVVRYPAGWGVCR